MAKLQRRGRGGASASEVCLVGINPWAASSSSTKLPLTASSNFDEVETSNKLAAEAVRSIQTCCKICFMAVFADAVITIIDGDILTKFFSTDNGNGSSNSYGPPHLELSWTDCLYLQGSISSKFFDADVGDSDATPPESPRLSWVDCVDLFDSLMHVVFGCGLWRMSQYYIVVIQGNERKHSLRCIQDEHFSNLLRILSIVWGINAANFALVAVSMAATLPTHALDGPLHFLLGEVSSWNAALVAVGTLAISSVATNAYCQKAVVLESLAHDRRISMHQRESKPKIKFVSKLGYRAYRNQALCACSFGLTAIMELLKWAVDADGGVVDRLLSISDVVAPFAIAWLLFGLNKSFLRAAIVRLRNDGSNTIDGEIYNNLFVAQTAFYKKVSEAMKDATIFRLLPYIVRPFGSKILSALEEEAPSVAAKLIQLFDFFT